MTPLARRLYPVAVLLSGILAALAVVWTAGRARRADRIESDRRTAQLVSVALEARMDALTRAVRGPAVAFDLGSLEPRYLSGVLRLAYAESDEISAVTLLDHDGSAIVPAVFLARAGSLGGPGRASESLEDLDRFAHEIPFAAALAHGQAVQGPYPSARGDGARIAIATAVPVADGTRTWVLAAEIDAADLLDGVLPATQDAAVAVVSREAVIGRSPQFPDDAMAVVRERLRRGAIHEPETLAGHDFRAVVVRAPAGLDGALAIAWSGEADTTRRLRLGETALGVIVVSIVGALAAALAVALRETPAPEGAPRSPREAQTLGAVVKELANPIAANTAAAQLLAEESGKSRVAETVQRSAMRVERTFRRVARLARSGQESARAPVDLAAIVRRECEAARAEIEAAGYTLDIELPEHGATIKGDADDLSLLVQVLLDASRAVAPASSAMRVAITDEREPAGYALRVRDKGTMAVRDRRALTDLAEGTRTEGAAPVLAWALAARIARDHRAEMGFEEVGEAGIEAVIRFERG